MLVLRAALNGHHINMAQCNKGAERKRHMLAAEEYQVGTDMAFIAYGRPLANVVAFKYLGHR